MAVLLLMETFSVSERRACRVVGQPRSVQREEPKVNEQEKRLVKEMRQHAAAQPRFGYRRVHDLLYAAGWRINHKQVHRLWRKEGLWVPRVQHKRTRLGCGENGILRHMAERRNHIWSYDFVMDRTQDGRRLKMLTVIDEFTRESLAIHVDRRINAAGVIEILARIARERGMPEFIRSDNGPEFAAKAVRRWLKDSGTATLFVEPGSPWQNGFIESFNGKLRDELLKGELFFTLTETRYLVERWREEYNVLRPHSALDGRTPAQFAATLLGGCAPEPGRFSAWRPRQVGEEQRAGAPLVEGTPPPTCLGPGSGARVAPQQSPILPAGYGKCSQSGAAAAIAGTTKDSSVEIDSVVSLS